MEVSHYVGGDLGPSSTGDLLAVDGLTQGQQRVLRRLLTNPGDYIFQPDYGAGLPKYVGSIADDQKIIALIKGQMLLEPAVARTPAPVVTLTRFFGGISVSIQYTDSGTSEPTTLTFPVGA
jgi:hypothetical protein